MGTNVIYLADLFSATPAAVSVPAYRRSRLRPESAGAPGHASSTASWAAAAQRRATLRPAASVPVQGSSTVISQRHTSQANNLPFDVTSSGRVGHLRLSGRLVDVCAELERLAQAEAAAEAMVRRA
jgi:hypothetical protein